MQVSSAGSVQMASALSALQAANKQPQLAAELLFRSQQSGAADVARAQQPATPVKPADGDADDAGGRSIDIRV